MVVLSLNAHLVSSTEWSNQNESRIIVSVCSEIPCRAIIIREFSTTKNNQNVRFESAR